MNKTNYVFLIGSAHQYTQVEAAIQHFNIDSSNITLLVQELSKNFSLTKLLSKKNNFQSVIPFLNWTIIDIFKFRYHHNSFISLCKNLKESDVDTIFLASHYSDDATFLFLQIVKPSKFFLLDEGTASFSVCEKRGTSEKILRVKLLLKSILYFRLISIPKYLIYFTRFRLEITNNDLVENYILNKQSLNLYFDFNHIAFFGSSIVELDMISEREYLNYLKEVLRYYFGKKILYYSHRKESKNKLLKIQDMGFELVLLDEPFEVHIKNNFNFPFIFSSFFTTSVIINLIDAYNCLPKLQIFCFPLDKLKKEKKGYRGIIDYLKSIDQINIIDLV